MSRATTCASTSASGGKRSYMPAGNKAGCRASLMALQAMHYRDMERTEKTCRVPHMSLWFPFRMRRLEAQRLDLDHVRQAAHGVKDRRSEGLIDFDEGDRILPRGGAAQMEGRDVDVGGAERVAQCPDEPGLVVVAHEQHVAAQLRFERDALERDDARLVAGEQRAGDLAPPPFGCNDDPDQGLVIGRLDTRRLAHADLALAA